MDSYGLKNVENNEVDVLLRDVKINGNVCGEFLELSMEQTFENIGSEDIEAVYIFPLPDTAVMTAFEANLGGRTLTAQIEDRKKTEELYEEALITGSKSFILEEIEENIFRINIGKLMRSEKVNIKVSYIDQLIYEDSDLKLVIPSILAPKYISNKDENYSNFECDGGAYKLSLNLLVEPLNKISIESPSHAIRVEWHSGNVAKVNFFNCNVSLNEDFVLLFKEREDEEASGMIYEYEENGESKGILYLRLIPELESDEEEQPRDYDFLIDISESMDGEKIEEAKSALQLCIRNLSEGDTFNIVAAENELHYFSKEGKVPYNEENLQRASDWIDNLAVLDDAEIFEALKYCLSEKSETGASTILVFTDDEGEQDEEILEYVKANIGDNRIFTFGIDTSASNYLINKLAEYGYGRPEFIYQGERIDDMVLRQFSRIENPQLDVTEISWGKMKVESSYPRSIDYFYNNEPFSIFAKVAGEIEGNITIKGLVGDKPYTKTINLDILDLKENAELIETVWVRKRIEALEEKIKGEKGSVAEAMRAKVVELSKEYGIISTETSIMMLETIEEPVLGMAINNIIPVKVTEEALRNITEAYFIESPSFLYKAISRETIKKNNVQSKFTRESILRILAKHQFADGTFANYDEFDYDNRTRSTAVAVLAFSLGREDISIYLHQMNKAVRILSRCLDDKTTAEDVIILCAVALRASIEKGIIKGSLREQIVGKLQSVDYKTHGSVKEIAFELLGLSYKKNFNENDLMQEKNSIYELALLAINKLI